MSASGPFDRRLVGAVDVAVIADGYAALRSCHAAATASVRVAVLSKGAFAASGCTHAIDSKIEFSVINWPLPDPDTPSTYAEDLVAIGRGLKLTTWSSSRT
jgi:succinate dehydrogenase/fumarate reductase flavoprotein subunit